MKVMQILQGTPTTTILSDSRRGPKPLIHILRSHSNLEGLEEMVTSPMNNNQGIRVVATGLI